MHYTDTVERFGEYIPEQSISIRGVPELIVGTALEFFVSVLHTSV